MSTATAKDGLKFYGIEAEELLLPYLGTVKAGFPSPAQNFMEEDIDLSEYFGMNKPNIRMAQVDGDLLLPFNAPDGSYLVCDTILRPQSGDLIIAWYNEEYIVRILSVSVNGLFLFTDNSQSNPTIVKEGEDFKIFGVVAQVIRSPRYPAGCRSNRIKFIENYDLVALLGINKPSVFLVRTDGDSMQDKYVPDKSYLVVDRSLRPIPNDVVVAVLNGEFTVKTLVNSAKGWMLYPGNPVYNPITVKEGDDFKVWGVVAQVIIDRKEMRKRFS